MNLKATALTATTVAIASLLPSVTEVDTQTAAAQQTAKAKTGYVKVDKVNLYPTTSVNNDSIGSIPYNTPVTILETVHDWYKVNIHNQIGYIKKDAITFTKSSKRSEQYIVHANALNVRSEPNTESSILDVLPNGKFVAVQETQGNWYKIFHNGQIGYVQKRLCI